MSQRPVYSYAPRSHAGNCPCSRCVQVRQSRQGRSGCGILILVVPVLIALIWPVAVWHGCKYGAAECGSGSDWVWDGQTWVACGIWWGACALVVAAVLAASAAGKRSG